MMTLLKSDEERRADFTKENSSSVRVKLKQTLKKLAHQQCMLEKRSKIPHQLLPLLDSLVEVEDHKQITALFEKYSKNEALPML